MAARLTPAPVKSEPGSFAWVSWYQQLHNYLNVGASVPWNVVDKTGASLSDLPSRTHAMLTAVGGTGSTHISASEGLRVTATMTIQSKAGPPTSANIAVSNWAIYKDTTAGTLKLWANDGGTLKSVALV